MSIPAAPCITVVTATWNRVILLTERCIPSVVAQDIPGVQHIIVSDGPHPETGMAVAEMNVPGLLYDELPVHDPEDHWGHLARLRGIELSAADIVTYCDDDDQLRPEHCRLMLKALDNDPEAGFAVSRMMSHGPHGKAIIGWGPLDAGNVGTPMIAHRKFILDYSTWGPASFTEDWDLVSRWLSAGVKCANVDHTTADVWPSLWRGN